MLANEAPKKIYFTTNENGTHYYTERIPFEREYIEFINIDAFINKACEWLKTLTYQEFAGAPQERLMTDEMIEDFKKAMEE